MRIGIGALCGLMLLLATEARAEEGGHERSGFHSVVRLGIGSVGIQSDDISIGGAGYVLDFGLGGAIAPNLILQGEIFWATAPNPMTTIGDLSARGGVESVSLTGLGPTLTYYFMPADIFLSGGMYLSWAGLSVGGDSSTSESGLGLRASLGKEWRVGNSIGLGIVASAGTVSISDAGTGLGGHTLTVGISLSN